MSTETVMRQVMTLVLAMSVLPLMAADYPTWRGDHQLQRSDDDILGIAFGCGFGSNSQLYLKFKAAFGCTPRQYRQRYRGLRA